MLPEYKCEVCGAEGVRLWRLWNTFTCFQKLFCCKCAEEDQGKLLGDTGDQIGWLCPAVPTEDNETYWGYSAVPQDRVEWWYSLPTERTYDPIALGC